MTLPVVLSIPHAGLDIAPEVAELNLLSAQEIADDGDAGAAAIYLPLRDLAADSITTGIARAFVDQNRARDDFRKDGVIKTHTCWDVPVYREPLSATRAETLLARYYDPYQAALARLAGSDALLGVDCHTMAAIAPPVAPDPGAERPMVCLGDGSGQSCPAPWTTLMLECLRDAFDGDVTLNEPFSGGHITRTCGRRKPWLQLELSRSPALSDADKSRRVADALHAWCAGIV